MSSCADFCKTPRDYLSDCGYCSCSCDCLSSKTTYSSEKHVVLPRVKKYKTVKERNLSSKKQKPKLTRRLSQSVEDLHRNVYPETVELCESMQNLCMSPRVFRAYNSISTHDQKILNRMAEKRSETVMRAENAWLADKMWQNEKYERDLRRFEQQEAYRKVLREKQEMDSRIMRLRFDEILRKDRDRLEELKKSLLKKDILSEERLERLRLQREARLAARHAEEARKFENILRANDENQLNDEIRKQNVYHHLSHRLEKADTTRKHYLGAYKRRLQGDNYREQVLHKENYEEALRFENYKREQLEDSILRKDQRITRFVNQRRRAYDESIEKAKLSSSLRELVRRSISPDNYQFGSGRLLYDRPISNLSILSSIKLG